MSLFKVVTYTSPLERDWNTFISESYNATFLFNRGFMEYHQDRFRDFSVLVYNQDTLVALLPANRDGDFVFSHQGLTYGGIITKEPLSKAELTDIVNAITVFLKAEGVTALHIKMIPEFYYTPQQDYSQTVLKKLNADLYHTNKVLSIDFNTPLKLHKTKRKHYKKGQELGFIIEKTSDFKSFWEAVLEPRIAEKFNTTPVHSLDEIQLLQQRFPKHIMQYNIYLQEELLAGITLFETTTGVKSQYGIATKNGEQVRALEFLFIHLIHHYKALGKQFFSMGTVSNSTDLGYSPGMLKQKQELGCKLYTQDYYKLALV